jgi:hypothetical protein
MKNVSSFFPEGFGVILLAIGVSGLVATGILSVTNTSAIANGTIPAMSMLIVILGLAFAFPTLLQEGGTGEISTMRVIILAVVLVFTTVYIKLGWIAGSFEEFTIDKSWIYILGLAFGGKALQKFAEVGEEQEGDKSKTNRRKKPEDGE